MTPTASHLALVEINNGIRYQRRCAAARMQPHSAAREFLHIAQDAAREDARMFDTAFSAQDILGAAEELCRYYLEHMAECDRLARHDAERQHKPGSVCA